jgi:hypothetical protein
VRPASRDRRWSIETLAAQHTYLALDHVESAGVLRRVVELQAAKHPMGLRRRKRFIKRSGVVRREIVHHDPDQVGLPTVDIDEVAHTLGEITRRPPVGDFPRAPWPVRVKEDEQIDRAIAAIFVIVTWGLSW